MMVKSRLLGAVGIVAVVGGIAVLMAQTPPPGPPGTADTAGPAFEVASLRLDHSRFANTTPLGQNRWNTAQATLLHLLAVAFEIPYPPIDHVIGVPDWGRTVFYAVSAKAEDGVLLNRETLELCLQRFLAERFRLVTHNETQHHEGYALMVAKGGPKMNAAKDGPPTSASVGAGRVHAPNIDMHDFAKVLEGAILAKPVVDETGLAGSYDFTLTFAPGEGTVFDSSPRSTDSSLPSVFTALEEQLGLKLVRRTAVPVEMLIIDHVEPPVLD
jgi:uncharacterized protein (TIGR03435 family)